jgi:hypothetical protein
MQEDDYPADRIYGRRDQPEEWEVQVLWKTYPWHLGIRQKPQMENKLPFSCPVCGRKKEYLVTKLVEGAALTCPFCNLTITLHGHMWQDVQKDIKKLKEKS